MVHEHTRAARIHAVGGPQVFALEEVTPPAPKPDEVRIAVAAAGVNYPDLLLRSGALPCGALPYTPGFEVAGTVEAVGAAVTTTHVGARVAAELPRGGGYATHVVADATALTPLPPALSFEQAVALLTSGRTALLMLRHARVAADDAVFVPGALGGVGHVAVQLAKALGARVIAGVGSDAKRDRALALGAAAAVTYAREAWADEVRALTDGKGADVVFQSTGGSIAGESLRALAPLGRLVLFGADNVARPEGLSAAQVRSLLAQGQTLGGFALMRTPAEARRRAFEELAELAVSGSLALSILRFPLSDVAEAHAAMESRGTVGKIVLTP